ncbi:ABC transporter ATP-binding protein [Xylanimonas ulmi]|uniref:ABC-2 type transport system ATP-binding protein n=1 Tax=Xylanimonas ulmi TaxID=228973 RepID=A0A4Q7LZU7_9MICO|nr:ABC transporter ATP-binding protein [Xylanibacterium ulmi]RZS60361.1 ABC-2 type transport system ATP-binding protein [Xylanibacterium ulmi]
MSDRPEPTAPAAHTPSAVEVRGLVKRRGAFHLGPLDLRVPVGFVTGFVGANGAGKTTTIKAMLGMVRPDAGTVRVPDRDRIGVVLDAPFLVPDWRVTEAARALRPLYSRWDERQFAALTDRFGLRPHQKVKDLSRGESTKLMVALALAHDPDLLILDEPTAGLDPAARLDLIDLLREFMLDERHSVVFSTHITTDLETFADQVVVIHDGVIHFTGARDDLVESYAMARGGPDDLTPASERLTHGLRRTPTGFEALIATTDTAAFGPGVVMETPTIDDVVARLGRGPTRHSTALADPQHRSAAA